MENDEWEKINLGEYRGGLDPNYFIEGINPEVTPSGIDLEEVRWILESNSSTTRRYDLTLGDDNFKIIALPAVYLCRGFGSVFGDTEFYLKHVPLMLGNGRLLEIGPGSGIISVASALHNRYTDKANPYVAIDINSEAVKCAQQNVLLNGLEGLIDVREGNVFDALKSDETFDMIFWNHPFHRGKEQETYTQMQGFDPLFQGTQRYAREGHNHLKPGGKLLLGTGNYAELDDIREVLGKVDRGLKLLKWGVVPFEGSQGHLNTYNIYEIVKRV